DLGLLRVALVLQHADPDGGRCAGAGHREALRKRRRPMDRSSVIGSIVTLLIGLIIGAAALSWWEGGRQSADIEALKVRLADERAQVQPRLRTPTDDPASEKQRREALEQTQQKSKSR